MNYTITDVKRIIRMVLEKLIQIKPMLTLLDQYTGDADLGITMEKGAVSLAKFLEDYSGSKIGPMLYSGGVIFNNASKSQMGKLLGNAIVALGNSWSDKTELTDTDILQASDTIVKTISFMGKAQRGDKTILDALIPMNVKFHQSYKSGNSLTEAFQEAAKEAKNAAKHTKGMVARVGRAKWVGERSRDFPDPGAVMCALLVDAIAFPERVGGYVLPKYE